MTNRRATLSPTGLRRMLVLFLLSGTLAAAGPPADESAWDVLTRRDPHTARSAAPAERDVLQRLTPAQAQAYADGQDAASIVLDNGQTLADLLVAKGLAGFSLSWSTVDGGGGVSTGGGYALTASIGQSDAGTLTGGSYSLRGGFLVGEATPVDPLVFEDGFETGDVGRWSSCSGCG